MTVWLYHINPKRLPSPNRPRPYGWDVDRPEELLERPEWEFPAGQMFKKVAVGDLICVYMKNIKPKRDGMYVVGTVSKVGVEKYRFRWRPDKRRSARSLASPVSPEDIHACFGRSYGLAMQKVIAAKQKAWLQLVGNG